MANSSRKTQSLAAAVEEGMQKELVHELTQKVEVLKNKRLACADYYKAEKKVTVQGSPMYRPYFGNVMAIILNGIAIHVPLDGQQYEIPESFAAVFRERISRIDEQRNMRSNMANVAANHETYAGEKSLIHRV